MDPLTLAGTAVTFLAPYLVKAGEKAAEEVGKKLPAVPGRFSWLGLNWRAPLYWNWRSPTPSYADGNLNG